MEPRIAIGITTTLERADVFHNSFNEWGKFIPPNCKIFFNIDIELKGVSISKNKVLAMCDYADFVFMVDDDIYPIKNGWWMPYIYSGLNHACWNYDRLVINETHFFSELQTPNGCMLFLTKKAIETCGGWDLDFKGYSYEHVSLSDRIFNAGLTPARYIDIPNSKGLFQMADCESSFTMQDRMNIPANYELYQQKFYSKEFKPFK